MAALSPQHLAISAVFAMFTCGCGDGSSSSDDDGGSSTGGTATGGTSGTGTGGTSGTATGGSGGTTVVPTPEGELFRDDFESGITKWDITQGTCSIAADETNALNCVEGPNEARAVAGDVWGEYSVSARIKVNTMGLDRRVYLAGRFTDSNNWYGAAIYNSSPIEVQIRKKVGGSSADVARGPFPLEFGRWYTLKLEMKGSTLRLFVDGVLQIETTDTEFASGKIALLVDRSDVSWDDVVVTNP
jgi:pectate lyase